MNPGRGIALKIVSTFVFTLMSVCVKLVADRIPAGEIVFCRSFFALIPVVAMLLWQGQLAGALRDQQALDAREPRRDRTSAPWPSVSSRWPSCRCRRR